MKKQFLMTVTAGALCMGLFACSKPAPKAEAPVAPAAPTAATAPAAPATTTPAAAGAAAPAPATAPAPANGPVTRFTATGFSPAWEAVIDGDKVTFSVPEIAKPDNDKRTIKVERSAYAKGATYNGKDGNVPFSLDIKGTECIKTGAKREFTATLAYGKSVYKGCADAMK